MASVSNSEYRHAQRTDGGPYAALRLLDELDLPTSVPAEIAKVEVFYSDTAVPASVQVGAKPWIKIMSIEADMLCIWPVNQRGGHHDYGKPLHGNVDRLFITGRIDGAYELPTTLDALDDFLTGLPAGFYRNWRYGLGLRWEYRSILATIAEIPGITAVCFHAPADLPGTDRLDTPIYGLGMRSYHLLRKEIDSTAARHQRAARKEKATLCHNRLLHRVAPDRFDRRHLSLEPNALADLAYSAQGKIALTKRDQRAAVSLVRRYTEQLARSEPAELMQLKQDIELVTLKDLIDRCSELMTPKTTETKWQNFLSLNPFVLTMAFQYPVFRIQDQPYVGGKLHTGRGGSYGDFLMSAAATNNLALVEIKGPGTQLLGGEYRGIFPPSVDLSGAVAQVVAQRAEFQASFSVVGRELDRQGYQPHSIPCVVIIGLRPIGEERAKAFEQYRQSLHGITVITFDELGGRLQALYDLLSPQNSKESHAADSEAPF